MISVGNITAGGTGKTPLVAWLAHWLRRRGLHVVLISRGYKARRQRPNDEALELQQRLPDVPHLQNPDRVAAARAAIAVLGCDVIVLDDAFQHRRIHRDLDIVLIDALEPFGYRHVLPRGLLREPLARLARAHVIGLSRADAVDAAHRAALQDEIHQLAPRAAWLELAHRPDTLVNAAGDTQAVTRLQGRRVAAFCGIGNPDAFRCSLESLGYTIAACCIDSRTTTRSAARISRRWNGRWRRNPASTPSCAPARTSSNSTSRTSAPSRCGPWPFPST